VCCPLCIPLNSKSEVTLMIPDSTFIFNGYGALSTFDDHELRLRHLLQQDALPTLKDSRPLLSVWEEVGK